MYNYVKNNAYRNNNNETFKEQKLSPKFLELAKEPDHFYETTGLVIRGRYVPKYWTVNNECTENKTHFDSKFGPVTIFKQILQILRYEDCG